RALLHRPALLYLDEPTANLDAHSAALVRRRLRQHTDGGGAVLLATHHLAEVEEICTRVAILNRGRLAAVETPAALRQRGGDLQEVYLQITKEAFAGPSGPHEGNAMRPC